MISVPYAIKNLLHHDHCYKNIRIHFPNGERSDICNDLIVKNSVSFTESLCSQNTLKFGLCESPVFECEVVGVGNIKDATIEVFCEIECSATVSGAEYKPDLQKYVYPISYGSFIVDECKRQADMIHRKIKAYNYLYHGLNFDISATLGGFYASRIHETEGNTQTSIEELIFTAYPTFFNERLYNYTEVDLGGLDHYSSSGGTMIYENYGRKLYIGYSFTGISSRTDIIKIDASKFKSNDNFEQDLETIIAEAAEQMRVEYDVIEPIVKNYVRTHEIQPHITSRYTERGSWGGQSSIITKRYDASGIIVSFPESIDDLSFSQEVSADHLGYSLHVVDGERPYTGVALVIAEGVTILKKVALSELSPVVYMLPRTPDTSEFMRSGVSGSVKGYSVKNEYSEINFTDFAKGLFEKMGLFAKVTRYNSIEYVNIKRQFGLNPQSNLYPSNVLYPQQTTGGKLYPKDYRSCWYDDSYVKKYGAVICNFKTVDTSSGEPKIVDADYSLFLNGFDATSDPSTYQIYELKNNPIINGKIAMIEEGEVKYIDRTWTPEQIEAICAVIAENLEGVTYMPVDFTGLGLPYVEAGDTFEILTKSNDSITTIVLNRTIKGEQTLTDSYKSV